MTDRPLQEVVQEQRALIHRHARGLSLALTKLDEVLTQGAASLGEIPGACLYQAKLAEISQALRGPVNSLMRQMGRVERLLKVTDNLD